MRTDGWWRKVRTRKDGHKTTTLRFHTTLHSRFDMREFPFDVQFLTLILKSRRFHLKGKNYMINLKNPVAWRKNHVIRKDADLLPEWELIKLWGAPVQFDKDVYNGYEIQICVRREYMSTLFNFGFPIFCIGMNSFAAYVCVVMIRVFLSLFPVSVFRTLVFTIFIY